MSKRLLGELELNRIYQRDALEGMRTIPDKSIDMILCDLPYGTTRNKWDSIIPLNKMWEQYERIIKDNGAIILTGQGLFSALLITSNSKHYRYSLIWEKSKPGGFLNARRMPLQAHEDILVFYKKLPKYYPQGLSDKPSSGGKNKNGKGNYGYVKIAETKKNEGNFPRSVLKFSNPNVKSLHPTQKPVDLFAYLIRTYSDEGDVILDNCMGSGTTAIAALRTGRQFIGFELEREYVEIANKRIDNELEAK